MTFPFYRLDKIDQSYQKLIAAKIPEKVALCLEEISAKLRLVSNVPPDSKTFPITPNAWEIQHKELYENPSYINKNHLPIELGDIFKKGSKKYILLAQPCDLMIRSNGKREPELIRVPLIEINKDDEDVKQCDTFSRHKYIEELPYFSDSQDGTW